jgi:hypothetical protein
MAGSRGSLGKYGDRVPGQSALVNEVAFEGAYSLRPPPRRASRSAESSLTVSDALAARRRRLSWPEGFAASRPSNDLVKLPSALAGRLAETLRHAA